MYVFIYIIQIQAMEDPLLPHQIRQQVIYSLALPLYSYTNQLAIHLAIENPLYTLDCKSPSDWKGISGKDLDKAYQGNELGVYQQKSLSQCKALCESNDQCFSIHYHTWQNSDFSNCNLKGGMFSDQSQITNNGGDWTLYWLFGCTSGS